MWFSTLLLLIVAAMVTARADDHDASLNREDADTNIFKSHGYPSVLEIHRSYVDTPQREGHRHKRAITQFLRDWLKLIKTTVWGGSYKKDGVLAKAFFKFGTYDDAIKDFYSLNPTSIEKVADILIGKVENQVIALIKRKHGPPILNVAQSDDAIKMGVINRNKTTRQVIYYKNLDEKLLMIRHMQTLQKPLH